MTTTDTHNASVDQVREILTATLEQLDAVDPGYDRGDHLARTVTTDGYGTVQVLARGNGAFRVAFGGELNTDGTDPLTINGIRYRGTIEYVGGAIAAVDRYERHGGMEMWHIRRADSAFSIAEPTPAAYRKLRDGVAVDLGRQALEAVGDEWPALDAAATVHDARERLHRAVSTASRAIRDAAEQINR